MAKPDRIKLSEKIHRLSARYRLNIRRRVLALVNFTEDDPEFKDSELYNRDLELYNIVKKEYPSELESLKALTKEIDRHNRPLDEELDQYLVDQYNCQIHTEFDLYSIEFSINMSDVAFFRLFSAIHNFIKENYKKPTATINKIKSILVDLSIEQQIFLLEKVISRLENGDDWNNEDHPQAVRILDQLYKDQALALIRYDFAFSMDMVRSDFRKKFFFEYLMVKKLIGTNHLNIANEVEKDFPIEINQIDNQEEILKTVKEDGSKKEVFEFLNEKGKPLLPYILTNFAHGTPTRSGLVAFIMAADKLNLFAIDVVSGGNQIKFIKALQGFLGNDSIKIGAYNSAINVYNRTNDEVKKEEIKMATIKINEFLKNRDKTI